MKPIFTNREERASVRKGGQNFKANVPGKEIYEVGREGEKRKPLKCFVSNATAFMTSSDLILFFTKTNAERDEKQCLTSNQPC